MAWLTLTDASGRDICVNMDCVMQFDPYHTQSGTETLLIFTAPGPDGKAASLHVRETAAQIRRTLLGLGQAVACPELGERPNNDTIGHDLSAGQRH
jgi:hypothetical protein